VMMPRLSGGAQWPVRPALHAMSLPPFRFLSRRRIDRPTTSQLARTDANL
jgi:hypothetical protein